MKLLERMAARLAFEPADLNGSAATGDYVSLKNYDCLLFLAFYGDGSAGNDIQFTVQQAQDVGGTGAKNLTVLETGRIYRMQAADYSTYAGLTALTEVAQATASHQYQPADTGENVGLVALEIDASDLDVDNGFDCVRVDVSDPGASKIVAGVYLLGEPRHAANPTLLPDPLAD